MNGTLAEVNRGAAMQRSALASTVFDSRWGDETLHRRDIRIDPADGSMQPGIPLALSITVRDLSGAPASLLAGACVEIWHCDAAGHYAAEAAQKQYLRGWQVTDDNGAVRFHTIYPGWYSGRTVHIHVRVRTRAHELTSQFFFDDAITDKVFSESPYRDRRARDTRNASDPVLQGVSGSSPLFLDLTPTGAGYAASIEMGIDPKTAALAKPAPGVPSIGRNSASPQRAYRSFGAPEPILPALYTLQGYVAAVRADGTIVTGISTAASGTVAGAKPGDLLELFGNGFGPVNPAAAASGQAAAPLANPVTITIGGAPAEVAFAGLSETGLCQLRVRVPPLSDGDYPVVAQVAGFRTQPDALLKVQA